MVAGREVDTRQLCDGVEDAKMWNFIANFNFDNCQYEFFRPTESAVPSRLELVQSLRFWQIYRIETHCRFSAVCLYLRFLQILLPNLAETELLTAEQRRMIHKNLETLNARENFAEPNVVTPMWMQSANRLNGSGNRRNMENRAERANEGPEKAAEPSEDRQDASVLGERAQN